ncbi:hypothetical protein EJ06DRAFT_490520 [Trichodelitschia bisporula]|uniref:General stress protein FMN-binding split barrel domain-containing protein n=1 Tax=Trichodelitschia bisporula TaxID=703511 RepID=A0A6G1I255_9PEZI|nr:hypothetical protein EJ06DRAFT_490520 [Trichodelitschia bisporula]
MSSSEPHSDPYLDKNLEDPPLRRKIADLQSFIRATKFCMMTTREDSSGLLVSRCMALAAEEDNGATLIFHTNLTSGKTDDLRSDSDVNLAFINPQGSWASVSGRAEVVDDRTAVRKYYSPALKAWVGDLGDGTHDGGPEDPRVGVIRVHVVTVQYGLQISEGGSTGREIVDAAKSGRPARVSHVRHVEREEVKEWKEGKAT